MYEERKSLGFLSFLFTLCHKLSKLWGFFVKETLKLYHYVTMGLAAGSMDLRGNFR